MDVRRRGLAVSSARTCCALLIAAITLASSKVEAAVPGGYSAVSNLNDPTLTELAQVALADWVDSSQGAYHCTDLADSDIDILQASQQVVAGTNYFLVFDAHLNCTSGPDGAAISLEAKVFQPLPYTNSPPQVQLVRRHTPEEGL